MPAVASQKCTKSPALKGKQIKLHEKKFVLLVGQRDFDQLFLARLRRSFRILLRAVFLLNVHDKSNR